MPLCISIIFKLFSFRFFFIFLQYEIYLSRLNYYSLYVSHFPSSMIIYSVYRISWKPKIWSQKSNKWLIGNFVIADFTTDRCCVCADCGLEFRIILPCIINSCSWFNDKHDLTIESGFDLRLHLAYSQVQMTKDLFEKSKLIIHFWLQNCAIYCTRYHLSFLRGRDFIYYLKKIGIFCFKINYTLNSMILILNLLVISLFWFVFLSNFCTWHIYLSIITIYIYNDFISSSNQFEGLEVDDRDSPWYPRLIIRGLPDIHA